ncbi:MAG: hypothetical protein BZ136_07600 [Methanosphaera sp. rholeuAM74]|nr:MAG: hypothetical protein BZ136_07600 [Methanosphaera sp. rholeuAM74]
MEFNPEKFKALISYIISRCENKKNVGKTVIIKLAYFSDFNFYEKYEKSITGETYLKYERGPYSSHVDQLLKTMKDNNEFTEKIVPFKGKELHKYYLTDKTDITPLSHNELITIDEVVDKLSDMTATRISDYSHGDMPWLATEDNGELDYEFVFYRDEEYEAT